MKIIFTLVLLFLVSASSVFAEGGSSGIGSAMPIANGVFAALPQGFVQVLNNQIQDGDQPILALNSLSPDQIKNLGGQWIPTRLGSVIGYEFCPSPESQATNTWVICSATHDQCTKLTPLNLTNRKIPAILGSLIRSHQP